MIQWNCSVKDNFKYFDRVFSVPLELRAFCYLSFAFLWPLLSLEISIQGFSNLIRNYCVHSVIISFTCWVYEISLFILSFLLYSLFSSVSPLPFQTCHFPKDTGVSPFSIVPFPEDPTVPWASTVLIILLWLQYLKSCSFWAMSHFLQVQSSFLPSLPQKLPENWFINANCILSKFSLVFNTVHLLFLVLFFT